MAFTEKIGTLTKTSTTQVQLTGSSIIKLGGQQRALTSPTLLTSVSGIGGIDTGAVAASSFYYVYAVYNGSSVGIVASLSASAPTGFTRYSKVGGFSTDSGSLVYLAFAQNDLKIASRFDTAGGSTVSFLGQNSLSGNGYQKMPNGIIIQWGITGSVATGGSTTVTFPIAFPTSCLNVQVTGQIASVANSFTRSAGAPSTSQVTLYSNNALPSPISWLAIGY